jgi:hypothetical protein
MGSGLWYFDRAPHRRGRKVPQSTECSSLLKDVDLLKVFLCDQVSSFREFRSTFEGLKGFVQNKRRPEVRDLTVYVLTSQSRYRQSLPRWWRYVGYPFWDVRLVIWMIYVNTLFSYISYSRNLSISIFFDACHRCSGMYLDLWTSETHPSSISLVSDFDEGLRSRGRYCTVLR